MKELQSLGLNVKVLDDERNEIYLRTNYDEEFEDGIPPMADDSFAEVAIDSEIDENFTVEDVDDLGLDDDIFGEEEKTSSLDDAIDDFFGSDDDEADDIM